MNKLPEELYKERFERFEKAVRLEEPDRVPITYSFYFFPAKYARITYHEYMYDYEKSSKAIIKVANDFKLDIPVSIPAMGGFWLSLAFSEYSDIARALRWITGPIHDVLGEKYGRFPGRELSENAPFQFIGGEYMKVEEYDMLIENPTKFVAEVILPRVCKNLENLGSVKAMRTLIKLGIEADKRVTALMDVEGDPVKLGLPMRYSSPAYAPLDFIGDFLRDIKNIILDIYRVPDKVKQACKALTHIIARIGVSGKQVGTQYAFIPLHLNEYLSPKLYNEFYWPPLKSVIYELTNAGIKPNVFYEGYHDPHLETILELPKGKTIAQFEKTDLRKAKEILGGHTCIMGGIPASLLIGGTPAKVEEYTKKLLEDLKPGGGFILKAGIPDVAKPENIKALVEASMKYGVY